MAKSGQCSSHHRQPVQRSAFSTTGAPSASRLEALPGAEGGADAAGLAPVPVDVDSILGVGLFGVLIAGGNRICFRGLTQFFL